MTVFAQKECTATPAALDPQEARLPGGAAAAMLSCGVGSAVLGVAVLLAEASESIKTALTWHQGVGPLSGKSLIGSAAFFLSWILLHFALRRRAVGLRGTLLLTWSLVGVGLLLTFPPVYQAFAPEAPPAQHAPHH